MDIVTSAVRPTPDTARYFAYGTLLGRSHMTAKYKTAKAVGIASYDAHELGFWRFGEGIDDGGCTIVDAPGRVLMGVIYEVDESELELLLAVNGVPGRWRRREIKVTDLSGKEIDVVTLGVEVDGGVWPPFEAYADLVLDGAAEAGLPFEYQGRLGEIVADARKADLQAR